MFSLIGRGGILPLTAVEFLLFMLFFCTVFLPASWISSLFMGRYEFFIIGLILILCTRFDRRSSNGGAETTSLRWPHFWRFFHSYFSGEFIIEDPQKFKEEVDGQQVLFCIHPHGIVSFGVWSNLVFASTDPKFTKQIPQLQSARIVTLSLNFLYPIWSQILTSIGFIGSSATSIQKAIERKKSVGIVIGGAAESLHSDPTRNEISLHIKSRRGFIREALISGIPLVPVFTFGEVDLYDVYVPKEGTMLYRFQRWFKDSVGFATPFITNFRPKPIPLVTVIGPPLVVPKIEEPTTEDLNLYHAKYLEHLESFYNRNKSLDPVNPNRTLVFN